MQRTFEINEVMGFGCRFRTTTLLEIFNFKEAETYKKLMQEDIGGGDSASKGEETKDDEKISLMAKLT